MRPEQRLDENFFEMFLVNSCQRLDNSQTASFLILLSAAIAMGVWKLFYDNSLGLLMRGCRRSSTETAIEANEDLDTTQESEQVEFDPGEFPPPTSPHNLSLLPEKALQKLVDKLSLEEFVALSATCRLLNEKMTDNCRLDFPLLVLYVSIDNGLLSFIYNLDTKHGIRWLPEHVVREKSFTYQEFIIIFKALGRFELSDVANDHYQKIQYKVKKVKVQTDCDVRTWGATLEEFDLFLRQVNCAQYIMNAAYPLPLEAVYYRQLGNIPICGRFDYGSQDVSQFAHYNPCVYLTATPLQVVINAIQLYNRRLFAIVQHIYIYRDRAPELLLFEQWLLKNGRDIRREGDAIWATVDSQESDVLRPVVYVYCSRTEIHLRGDFIASGAETSDSCELPV